ncbi:MAG: hypothetical protein KatS3mg108_2673 [Isosphaeraceae bacterium]|jgi:uncharacterized protein (TIGR03067 family)|nr:MAG: hypothetical protein KatS3mg108_2673 [Isosphaeraceae bacterium]
MLRRLIVLLALAAQDAPPTSPHQAELQRHQGTWHVVSFIYNGTEADPEIMASIRRIVEDDRVLWTRDGKRFAATRLELDPTTSPPTLKLIPEGGRNRGQTVHGIYRLDGDRLTLCTSDPGEPPPSAFSAPAGSRRTLVVLTREPPAAIDHPEGKPQK